ncbi:MAG: T9SS type A sorting domain-containing protein [Sphingobacteriales bacterium]|nr:MAG: T9SS type A sorting domain-containing protein [Sphingobacteriales bacterium]
MKRIYLAILLCMALCSPSFAQDYNFSGTMSREKLELYLNRAITMAGLVDENSCYFPPCTSSPSTLYNPTAYNASVNMLANINARFIGRSCGLWAGEWVINGGFFSNVGVMVNDINNKYTNTGKVKPVIQAAIFEIISSDVNGIMMSAEVAATFGIAQRNFRYNDMLYSDGSYVNQWGTNASVPDMSKTETQMWFYFMATQYIDRGIEAIHLGQVELMDDKDPDHSHWWSLLSKIREYAKTKNRGVVLLDAHTFGLYYGSSDQLLFDFHSSPIRMQEKLPRWSPSAPDGGTAFVENNPGCGTPFNRTKGGKTYFGWYAVTLPYLVELDNFGISGSPNNHGNCWFPWGWDEITWFGVQSEAYRNNWLKYAYYKVKCLDDNAFLQMPGRRGLTEAGVPWPGHIYRAANGYDNQEHMIKNTWNGAYTGQDNWVHHNFTQEEVYLQPDPPLVSHALVFVDQDKAFYIGADGYIHGYIKDNGATGIWRTVSPSYSAQIFNGQNVTTQVRAASDLVASPDGKTLLYIGTDGYIYGFTVNTVWNYSYFAVPKTQMIQQNLRAISGLQFTSNSRLFYVARELGGNKNRVHGFIRSGSTWSTTSPTHASNVASAAHIEVGGALTYNPYDNRLYYVGTNGFLYYHSILTDWTFTYNVVPQSAQIAQNLRIMPTKLAIRNNKIFYIGRELAGNALRIHALVYSGATWNTVSPTHSANTYNSQPLSTQVQSNGNEIAVSPDGSLIAYIGTNKKVYYYKDITAGWNFSYNDTKGTDGFAASNSLQYFDNQNIYYNSQFKIVSTTPLIIEAGDRKVHNIRLQESYCENAAIRTIEPAYQYMAASIPMAQDAEFVKYVAGLQVIVDERAELLKMKAEVKYNSISIYPNPATDEINIQAAPEGLTYVIYNISGVMQQEGSLKDNKINTAGLLAGDYVVSFLKDNTVIATIKFTILR